MGCCARFRGSAIGVVISVTLLTTVALPTSGSAAPPDESAAAGAPVNGAVVGWGSDNAKTVDVPKFLTGVTQLDADNNSVVALKSDGTVVMWGQDCCVPAGLTGVTQIGVGDFLNVALKSDGTVVTFGLGSGDAPVPPGLSGVVAVDAGSRVVLAVKSDGTVVGFGKSFFGTLDVPAGLSNVTAVALGQGHALALKSDGTVVALGSDFFGQTDVPGGCPGAGRVCGRTRRAPGAQRGRGELCRRRVPPRTQIRRDCRRMGIRRAGADRHSR